MSSQKQRSRVTKMTGEGTTAQVRNVFDVEPHAENGGTDTLVDVDFTPSSERTDEYGITADRYVEIMDLCTKIAKQNAHKTNLERRTNLMDADDVAMEAATSVFKALKAGKTIDDLEGYIRRATYSRASRGDSSMVGKADMAAYTELCKIVEAERAAGKDVNSERQNEIAAEIWENWPDRNRRPHRNFLRNVNSVRHGFISLSVDAHNDSHGTAVPDLFLEPEASAEDQAIHQMDVAEGTAGRTIQQGSFKEQFEDFTGDERKRQRLEFNALVEDLYPDALVAEGCRSQNKTTEARAALLQGAKAEDGPAGKAITQALDAYENGEKSPQVEGLFGPWGDDAKTRETVADVFASLPESHRWRMWESASQYANARLAKRRADETAV